MYQYIQLVMFGLGRVFLLTKLTTLLLELLTLFSRRCLTDRFAGFVGLTVVFLRFLEGCSTLMLELN
jgi:hypothetical protein